MDGDNARAQPADAMEGVGRSFCAIIICVRWQGVVVVARCIVRVGQLIDGIHIVMTGRCQSF